MLPRHCAGLFLLMFLISTAAVTASAGVRGPGVNERLFDFEPGKVIEATFSIYGAERLELLFQGDLVEYSEIVDPNPGGGPRDIQVRLTLPESLEPGEHKIYVGALEEAAGGMVGGRAGAMLSLTVKVLSAQPAIQASMEVDDVGVGTPMTSGHLDVESWTKLPFSVSADLSLRDSDGTQLYAATLPARPLAPNEAIILPFNIPTKNLRRGVYIVNATVNYGGEPMSIVDGFRVGERDVSLIKHTEAITAGSINRFDFTLESDWNEELKDVYGDVYIGEEFAGRTPTGSLSPFGEGEFTAYIDATALSAGNASGTIIAHFDDVDKPFPFNLSIVSTPTPSVATQQEADAAAGKGSSLFILYAALVVLTIVVLILVVLNVLLLRRREGGAQPPNAG